MTAMIIIAINIEKNQNGNYYENKENKQRLKLCQAQVQLNLSF